LQDFIPEHPERFLFTFEESVMHEDLDLHEAVHSFIDRPFDIGRLFCHVDPAPTSVQVALLHDDLCELEKCSITSVRELLDARPSTLLRQVGIPASRMHSYCLIARWSLLAASHWRRGMLAKQDWSEHAVGRLSNKTAHLAGEYVASGRKDEPMQVIVQMADVIPPEALGDLARGERIERLRKHAEESQAALLRRTDLRLGDGVQIWLANQMIVWVSVDQLLRLANNDAVRRIGPTLPLRPCLDEALPRVRTLPSPLGYTGTDQIVAVIDSGVNELHSDFHPGQVVHQHTYIDGNCSDEHGHGTHVAGIVASHDTTYAGVAPEAAIWCYRVLDSEGKARGRDDFHRAVQDAVQDAAKLGSDPIVINCSLEVTGGSFNSEDDYESYCDLFDSATNDAVVVAAAGNSGPDNASITAPGGGKLVLTVGASVNRPKECLDVVAPFSSRGPGLWKRQKPDVVAPGGFALPHGDKHKGVSMVSSKLSGGVLDRDTTNERPWPAPADPQHYGISGTSQAAALVSGVAALLLQHVARRKTRVHPTAVADAIKNTAGHLGFGKYEEGSGLINLDRALAAL
jgi:serine protease AprX